VCLHGSITFDNLSLRNAHPAVGIPLPY
jgi:hypothetical protein